MCLPGCLNARRSQVKRADWSLTFETITVSIHSGATVQESHLLPSTVKDPTVPDVCYFKSRGDVRHGSNICYQSKEKYNSLFSVVKNKASTIAHLYFNYS